MADENLIEQEGEEKAKKPRAKKAEAVADETPKTLEQLLAEAEEEDIDVKSLSSRDKIVVKTYRKDGDKRNRAGFVENLTLWSPAKAEGIRISLSENKPEIVGVYLAHKDKVVKLKK